MSETSTTKCVNPLTGEILGEVSQHSTEDVLKAIKKAREAQKVWKEYSVKERVLRLKPIKNFIVDRADQIAETISRDSGKVRLDAMVTEVINSLMALSYYSHKAPAFLKDRWIKPGNLLMANKWTKLICVPYGVIGIITPWNYPFTIAFSEIILGLITGNAILFKTASETQMVGHILKEAVEQADLPEGLFHYLNLPGTVAGDAFLEAGVNKLFFTGSVAVGKYLMKKASETLTPVNLELGGNDAMIVCEDADLERAATGAVWAGFSNAGQSCGGVERIYVHQNVYKPFLKILKKKIEQFRIGYPFGFDIDMGGITTKKQMNVVNLHIEDALSKGAKIYAQSELPDDSNYQNLMHATILTDVKHDMDVMRHETFGPVVGVMSVEDMDEAVRLANDSYLGLTGSVWSRDRKKAEVIARKIQAGVITVNDHLMSHGLPETSWGGFKQSGIGRSHGQLGFYEMTQPQMIVHDFMPGVKKNVWWHPYSQNVYEGMKGMIDFLYNRNIFIKIKGMMKLLRTFLRTFRAGE